MIEEQAKRGFSYVTLTRDGYRRTDVTFMGTWQDEYATDDATGWQVREVRVSDNVESGEHRREEGP